MSTTGEDMSSTSDDDMSYNASIPTPEHDDDNAADDQWAPASARGDE